MPSLAFLLRCLLVVTLCLDAWPLPMRAAAGDAPTADAVTQTAAASIDDCERQGAPDGKHRDCDCDQGACGCACFLSIAALPSVAASLLPPAPIAEPLARSAPFRPTGLRTPLFRPPIA